MIRKIVMVAHLVSATAAFGQTGNGNAVRGAWRVVQTGVREPGADWTVRPAPQGGLYVFSDRHYSYFYVFGATERKKFADANRATDAEKVAAYDSFIAGAGTYTLDGESLVLKADYRKNPSEMNGDPWHLAAELRGDTMRLVFSNPPFLPGREWRTVLVRAN